jgi:hypothetical protein
LVPDRALLDVGEGVDADIVAVWRAGESLKVEDATTSGTRGTIRPAASGAHPVVYDGRFSDESPRNDSITHIEQCAGRFDLVEAFERMRTALQLLAKEDSRYA